MCAHVVVAEDDELQAELIRRYLEHEGHDVVAVHDGRAALEEVRRSGADLLILDVMMPRVDGLDVCRILRAESDIPVIILSARSAEDDVLLGLDLGADDYMTKPFSPRELMARVRTALRRARAAPPQSQHPPHSPHLPPQPQEPDPILRVGGLTVDPVRHQVTAGGRLVDCTPGEFELLEVLASEPGRVFTREQLLQRHRGSDRYITTRTVDVHVMNLRRKIEPRPWQPSLLVTVYGVGYKLTDLPVAPVAPAATGAPAAPTTDGG